MPLIDMEARIIADSWREGDLIDRASGEPLIVSAATLARLTSDEIEEASPIGVRMAPATTPESLSHALDHLGLILVEFPSFRDGRGFTIAATLRNRYAFKGELRATGHVLPDQFEALRKCGFSSLVTPPGHPPEQWRPQARANAAGAPLLKRLLGGGGLPAHQTLHFR